MFARKKIPNPAHRDEGIPGRSKAAALGGRNGFSLIEVMCAILILGVALVGLSHGLTTALGSNKESERQTQAALIAAGQLELLRSEGLLDNGVTEGDAGGKLTLYRWKQSISATDIDGLHDVEIRVEDSNSGDLVYSLRTLLFEIPVETTSGKPGSTTKPKSKPKSKGSGSP
jgi:prepilin-type N-terminal cleavage/methylation domain-containing protein